MNKLANFVKETRKDFWKDDNAKKLVDIFEQQAEIAFAEHFRSNPLVSISCRVFGIVIEDIMELTFVFSDIVYDTDTSYETDAEAEEWFRSAVNDFADLNESFGTTFNGKVSIKGLQPFTEELKSRGYKVLNAEDGSALLIYFIVSE